jgi:hypothetical protein
MVLETGQLWAIDLDWLKASNRSFSTLVKGAVCPKCRKKLKIDTSEAKPSEIFKLVKSCCGKTPDYITPTLPLHESAFRILLANGNTPMTLEEMSRQLSERRGIDAYRTSPMVLNRLFTHDQHYGLRRVG